MYKKDMNRDIDEEVEDYEEIDKDLDMKVKIMKFFQNQGIKIDHSAFYGLTETEDFYVIHYDGTIIMKKEVINDKTKQETILNKED
jgi:hypothetical protein